MANPRVLTLCATMAAVLAAVPSRVFAQETSVASESAPSAQVVEISALPVSIAPNSAAPAPAAFLPAPIPEPAPPAPPPTNGKPQLPPYLFPWNDGLFASAAGFVGVKNVCFPCQKNYTLNVTGMCCSLPVKAGIQDGPAPLVVVLLGVGAHPEDDFSKLWASWYFENGYHVLTFDSTFTQDFNSRAQQGVSGNLWVETEAVRDVIDAFLHQTPVEGRITKIGVVGMSYGGIQALMLGTMAAEKKLPFEIAAIQAYSPPLKVEAAARIIDGWYAETYGKFTLEELLKLRKIKPDPKDPKSPVPEDKLKAAISLAFHEALPRLIVYSDMEYHLNKLPKGDDFTDKYVREDYASRWTFIKFAYGMSYDYWQKKLALPSLEPLIHAADLPVLIEKQPPMSEIILSADDPLDTAADMASFKAYAAAKSNVTILPNGGHLGYVSLDWTKAKLMTLFPAK